MIFISAKIALLFDEIVYNKKYLISSRYYYKIIVTGGNNDKVD